MQVSQLLLQLHHLLMLCLKLLPLRLKRGLVDLQSRRWLYFKWLHLRLVVCCRANMLLRILFAEGYATVC